MLLRLLYKIKYRFRPLFCWIEDAMGSWICLRNRRKISRALESAVITGDVYSAEAEIRPLNHQDLNTLVSFFSSIPNSHLEYFQPHGFSKAALDAVLRRRHIFKYGLFRENEIIGYLMLKLYPGKKAFLGTLVSPEWAGKGVGTYFSYYLRWQCRLLGFRLYSTISKDNVASLKSHEKVGAIHKVVNLPNDYFMYFHPLDERDDTPPDLQIPSFDVQSDA
jgi:RimJ/RimL family protein N-acetyltransferase